MNSDRTFEWTFFVSLACHVVLLVISPGLRFLAPPSLSVPVISFVSLPQPVKAVARQFAEAPAGPAEKAQSRERTPAENPAQKTVASDPTRIPPPPAPAKTPPPASVTARSHASAVPVRLDELKGDARYTNYYKVINERLQRAALPPAEFSEGQITLSFVVMADGSLASIDVVPDSSSASSALRQSALQIVRSASPFPPFPNDLHRVDLTFNVVICFREQS